MARSWHPAERGAKLPRVLLQAGLMGRLSDRAGVRHREGVTRVPGAVRAAHLPRSGARLDRDERRQKDEGRRG